MIRITGGTLRGRSIKTPPGHHTRPTQSRLREAIFSSVQNLLDSESSFLDLFAGSGALGFEALSRGAGSCVFVEQEKTVMQMIQKNADQLGVVAQCEFLMKDAIKVVSCPTFTQKFDVIIADPPYQKGWELKLLENSAWADLLKPEGRFLVEWSRQDEKKGLVLPKRVGVLEKVRQKNYGDSVLSTYRFCP